MTTPPLPPVYFLLVDDLEENLLALEGLLRREGLILLQARSGSEALELLLKYDVALALLDVQMPDMDGFELAELMRGHSRTQAVPIIFLTAGSISHQRRFRGYEAGAVDFIGKPIEPDILRSKAGVFFELYRQRQQLARQHEALMDADRRKDEFLATLAHELRNPLAPIRNGLQVLRLGPKAEIAAQVHEMMEQQIIHLVRLIDDLLDISRITKGKIDLRKEHLTLQSALHIAIETCRPLIDAQQHTLHLHIPDEPLWLDADPIRLSQIIGNLLNNAAKYTPENGNITLSVQSTDREAIIAIADNGLGIPADMLPKVFELFTQVGINLERAQGGLGIGLALVKQLAAMHGGTITAESGGLNMGSTFTLRLPLSSSASLEPSKAVENSAISPDTMPLKILVVDDNIASAKTTGWMLEEIGYKPTLAHNGADALRIAQTLKPDVILLDIGMPEMSGYIVCRELRKDPLFKNTILIAQTGWGQERDRKNARDAGFNHHLVKPVSLEDLSKILVNSERMIQRVQ